MNGGKEWFREIFCSSLYLPFDMQRRDITASCTVAQEEPFHFGAFRLCFVQLQV